MDFSDTIGFKLTATVFADYRRVLNFFSAIGYSGISIR